LCAVKWEHKGETTGWKTSSHPYLAFLGEIKEVGVMAQERQRTFFPGPTRKQRHPFTKIAV
jgi:hypothetical protein